VYEDKGVTLTDREMWVDKLWDGVAGTRVGGLPGTSRLLGPAAFAGTDPEIACRVSVVERGDYEA
jgi:hypothetical protein